MNTPKNFSESISPKEFTRLWNLLLTKGKKELCGEEVFPKTILSLEFEPKLLSKLSIVVGRVNPDKEFQKELFAKTGHNAFLSVSRICNQIQIVATPLVA